MKRKKATFAQRLAKLERNIGDGAEGLIFRVRLDRLEQSVDQHHRIMAANELRAQNQLAAYKEALNDCWTDPGARAWETLAYAKRRLQVINNVLANLREQFK